jgi:hypothetical protein
VTVKFQSPQDQVYNKGLSKKLFFAKSTILLIFHFLFAQLSSLSLKIIKSPSTSDVFSVNQTMLTDGDCHDGITDGPPETRASPLAPKAKNVSFPP